ncbi:MFS transporter [Solibacillus sp. NPDC093137]|uniref:MFS transporter n=1 Tax=Solibacillus sp. NPDC093137 TaxID=3390678 RepID=UPI003D05114B
MRKNSWFIYIVLLLGIFVALEANAFSTPAIPYISADFGISVANSGVLTLLASAAAIALSPLFGRLGDQIGRKKVIVAGLIIFVLAQTLKVFTPHVSFYLIGALFQGVGYALIFPNVFAYIPELFPTEKRGKAIGLFMLFSYIATGTGGAISGALIETWGWRSVYAVSAFLSLIGLLLISLFVPKSERGKKSELDYKGVTIFMTAITLLVGLPLIYTNFGVSWLIGGAVTFVIVLLVFLQMQKKEKNPTVDLKLLKMKGVYIPSILIAVQNFMMLSILMSLTFLAADNPNVSALQVGMITTVLFTTAMVISPLIGYLLDRFNPIYLVYLSIISGFIGIVLYLRVDMTSSLMTILTVMAFVGICSSLLNASLMKIVINYTPEDKKGVSTGTFTLFKDLGLPIGSTLGLTIYGLSTSRGFDSAITASATELGLNAEQTVQLIEAKTTGEIPMALDTILAQANVQFTELLSTANMESVAAGIQTLGIINLALFIVIALISLGLLKLKPMSVEVPELNVQQNTVLEEV